MTISQQTRQTVRENANGCCEYCRLSSDSGTVAFHIDHIRPIKHGGTDDTDNLCLACYNCNLYKSHDLTGIDPITDKITPLFNPRKMTWTDHFHIQSDMRFEGLTSIGRTTIRVLQINLEERVESRQILAELDEYPCQLTTGNN